MKLADFETLFKNEVRNLTFPSSSTAEQLMINGALAAVFYGIDKMINQYSGFLVGVNFFDANGNIDIDWVEHTMLNGLPYPLNIGTYRFSQEDVKKIFDNIKRMEQPAPQSQPQSPSVPQQVQPIPTRQEAPKPQG